MAAIQRPAPARPWPTVGRSPKVLLLATAAIVVTVAMLQINQFSAVTTTGYEIEALKRERADVEAANHLAETEVAWLSSLARVDIEARVNLGMVPATRVLYIDVLQPVPDHQTLPTRFLPAEEEPAVADSATLMRRILDLLPF